MNYDTLKPDVESLQTTVIDWLKDLSNLMEDVENLLGSEDNTSQEAKKLKEKLNQESERVEKVELVMAIAAPMNAGKSTIINALIGQDVLPNRRTGMTTLPTKVVFGQEEQPTLRLTNFTLSIFQNIWDEIRSFKNQLNNDKVKQEIEQFSYLKELLEEIKNSEKLPIHEKTSGRDELIQALTKLNDMVRLYNLMRNSNTCGSGSENPLLKLVDVPRIETRLWQTRNQNSGHGIMPIKGKLVIVDTPGHNEAGQEILQAVVTDQLDKSLIILLVLNFDNLNNKAADEIKQKVLNAIQQSDNYENLYVLVNKIDLRNEQDDMNSEEVNKFVHNNLNLFEFNAKNQIFECSAMWALCAAKFIQELQHPQTTNIHQMTTFKEFNKHIFAKLHAQDPRDTEVGNKIRRLNDIFFDKQILLDEEIKKELQIFAEELWEHSHFEVFMNQAIKFLMKNAIPKVVESSIKLISNDLNNIYDGIIIRASQNNDREKIQLIIKALTDSLTELDNCYNDINHQANIFKIDLNRIINQEFNNILNEANKKIDDYLNSLLIEDAFQDPSRLEYILKSSEIINQKWNFTDKDKAEQFVNDLQNEIDNIIIKLLKSLSSNIKCKFDEEKQDILGWLKTRTQNILTNAQKTIKDNFDKELILQSPIISNGNGNILKISLDEFKYDPESNQEKSTHWWAFWNSKVLSKYKFIQVIKEIFTSGDRIPQPEQWTFEKDKLLPSINQQIQDNFERINDNVNESLNEDLKKRLDTYIDDLKSYLNKYQDSLQQSLDDQLLNNRKKEELENKLQYLKNQTKIHRENTKIYLKYIEELMKSE